LKEIKYKGKIFKTDDDEFLISPNQYCKEWTEYSIQKDNIKELTEEHYVVINQIREFYKIHGEHPVIRNLMKLTGYNLRKIFQLFPLGPGKSACKIAGIPKPKGCM